MKRNELLKVTREFDDFLLEFALVKLINNTHKKNGFNREVSVVKRILEARKFTDNDIRRTSYILGQIKNNRKTLIKENKAHYSRSKTMLLEERVITEGIWSNIKYGLGKLGSLKKGGKIFKRKGQYNKAKDQIEKIKKEQSGTLIKDLEEYIEEKVPKFPNNKEHNDFLEIVEHIYIIYDSLVQSAQKDVDDSGFMAVDMANEGIEKLRIYVKYLIDYKLADVYKYFENKRDLFGEGETLNEFWRRKKKQQNPEQSTDAIDAKGDQTHTGKGLRSRKWELIVGGIGAALGVLGWITQTPWFEDLMEQLFNSPQESAEKVVTSYTDGTFVAQKGEGVTQILDRVFTDRDINMNMPTSEFIEVLKTVGKGDLTEGVKGIAPFLDSPEHADKIYQALENADPSQPLVETFSPDSDLSGQKGSLLQVSEGNSAKIVTGIKKAIITTIVKQAVTTGTSIAAGAAGLGSVLLPLGIILVAGATTSHFMKRKAVRQSRFKILEDLLKKLQPVTTKGKMTMMELLKNNPEIIIVQQDNSIKVGDINQKIETNISNNDRIPRSAATTTGTPVEIEDVDYEDVDDPKQSPAPDANKSKGLVRVGDNGKPQVRFVMVSPALRKDPEISNVVDEDDKFNPNTKWTARTARNYARMLTKEIATASEPFLMGSGDGDSQSDSQQKDPTETLNNAIAVIDNSDMSKLNDNEKDIFSKMMEELKRELKSLHDQNKQLQDQLTKVTDNQKKQEINQRITNNSLRALEGLATSNIRALAEVYHTNMRNALSQLKNEIPKSIETNNVTNYEFTEDQLNKIASTVLDKMGSNNKSEEMEGMLELLNEIKKLLQGLSEEIKNNKIDAAATTDQIKNGVINWLKDNSQMFKSDIDVNAIAGLLTEVINKTETFLGDVKFEVNKIEDLINKRFQSVKNDIFNIINNMGDIIGSNNKETTQKLKKLESKIKETAEEYKQNGDEPSSEVAEAVGNGIGKVADDIENGKVGNNKKEIGKEMANATGDDNEDYEKVKNDYKENLEKIADNVKKTYGNSNKYFEQFKSLLKDAKTKEDIKIIISQLEQSILEDFSPEAANEVDIKITGEAEKIKNGKYRLYAPLADGDVPFFLSNRQKREDNVDAPFIAKQNGEFILNPETINGYKFAKYTEIFTMICNNFDDKRGFNGMVITKPGKLKKSSNAEFFNFKMGDKDIKNFDHYSIEQAIEVKYPGGGTGDSASGETQEEVRDNAEGETKIEDTGTQQPSSEVKPENVQINTEDDALVVIRKYTGNNNPNIANLIRSLVTYKNTGNKPTSQEMGDYTYAIQNDDNIDEASENELNALIDFFMNNFEPETSEGDAGEGDAGAGEGDGDVDEGVITGTIINDADDMKEVSDRLRDMNTGKFQNLDFRDEVTNIVGVAMSLSDEPDEDHSEIIDDNINKNTIDNKMDKIRKNNDLSDQEKMDLLGVLEYIRNYEPPTSTDDDTEGEAADSQAGVGPAEGESGEGEDDKEEDAGEDEDNKIIEEMKEFIKEYMNSDDDDIAFAASMLEEYIESDSHDDDQYNGFVDSIDDVKDVNVKNKLLEFKKYIDDKGDKNDIHKRT